jgi:regulatory protein
VPTRSTRKERPALDAAGLERLAIDHVARYATGRVRLILHLRRKLVERGWSDAIPPDIEGVVGRLTALGYIDDAALAEARGRSLARRGLGRRRVGEALAVLGIAVDDRAGALAAADAAAWETALRFAKRRRIGPFAEAPADADARRRATATMIRAGHAMDHVRKIIAAPPGVVPTWDEY